MKFSFLILNICVKSDRISGNASNKYFLLLKLQNFYFKSFAFNHMTCTFVVVDLNTVQGKMRDLPKVPRDMN